MPRTLPIPVLCAVMVVGGCGSDSAPDADSGSAAQVGSSLSGEAQATVSTPQEATERAKPKIWSGSSSNQLVVRDLVVGSGPVAQEGDILFVRYAAGIHETGEEIEPARSAGEPVGFLLGGGDWAYGWEEGMAGMRVGGRRVLIFPTTATTVPPGSTLGDTLIYVVDLLSISGPTG